MIHKKAYFLVFAVMNIFYVLGQNKYTEGVNFNEFRKIALTDSNSGLKLDSIHITGNRKTKDYIILREMNMVIGDTINPSTFYERLLLCRESIYNTNLFSDVQITPILISAYRFSLNIKVIEKWFIYPIPQFQIIDRNFNEWWKTYHGDFNRVIYGLKFLNYNFSGRADRLNAVFLNGYNRYFSLGYSEPYSDKKLNQGFFIGTGFTQNKEFAYKTDYTNKLIVYKKNFFTKRNLYFSSSFFVRKGLYKKHSFGFQYNTGVISDSFVIKNYNPHFLNDSSNKISFPDFSYAYQYVKTDNNNYPLKGTILNIGIGKRGFGLTGGLNMLSVDIGYRKFYSFSNHFYSSIQLFSKIKVPFRQAYINQRALGYGDYYLRGLEYYVIDGVASCMSKITFNKKIVQTKIPLPVKIKTISCIPLTIFAKTYADAGYVYNKKEFDTRLNNRLLYTAGLGFDIITLYDMKCSIEFSINQMNEKGLFLHSRGIL